MRHHSLKMRFISAVTCVYLILGLLTFLAFHLATTRMVRSLGTKFAMKQALLEKSKLISAIQRDLSLSLKMAGSPLLKRWALDEHNEILKKQALEELESYRTNFDGQSLFFVIDRSRHYYFSDGTGARPLEHPRYTLNPGNVNDAWYFRVMREVDTFELNVDYDNHLDVTKVWFNVVIKDSGHNRIGLGGSGIDVTRFINEIVNPDEQGVETILLNADGVIEGHRDRKYVIDNSKVRGTEKKTTIYDLMDSAGDITRLKSAIVSLSSGGRDVETCYLTVGGKRYLAAISQLKEIKWFNLVLVDVAHVINSREFLPILLITIISLLAVVVIIGLLLNRLVLTPLSALAGSSRQIALGNFDIAMTVESDDEIGALTRSFNDMARMVKDHTENLELKVKARTEELNLSNQKLAESNRQVMDSILYARLIQASILPEEAAIRRYARDFFVLYRPRDIVGGDFYYFRECGENCVIAVLDCTGHGVPGAFMTMTANAVLDHVLDTIGNDDPSAILKEFNRLIRAALRHESVDAPVDIGLDIGLCCCAPAQGRLLFAGARMDLHHVAHGTWDMITGDKQPIGYRDSNVECVYTTSTVNLDDGTMFYLASDGILDQSGGAKGWGFGRKRFNELLARISGLPAADQKTSLEEALAHYQGDYPQRDDITVIGFRL